MNKIKYDPNSFCQVCHDLDVAAVEFLDGASMEAFSVCLDCLHEAVTLAENNGAPQNVKGYLSIEGGALSLEIHPTDGESEVIWLDKLEGDDNGE